MKKNKQLYYWAFAATIIVVIVITSQWVQKNGSQQHLSNTKSTLEATTQTHHALNIEQKPNFNDRANTTASKADTLTQEQHLNEKIAALIQKRLTPAMIQEINQKLNPANQSYTEVTTDYGAYIDLRGRASTVSIALIDEDGELIVTDITNPIPIPAKNIGMAKQEATNEELKKHTSTAHSLDNKKGP